MTVVLDLTLTLTASLDSACVAASLLVALQTRSSGGVEFLFVLPKLFLAIRSLTRKHSLVARGRDQGLLPSQRPPFPL